MKRIGGQRRKTRGKLSKPLRQRGKLSLSRFFAKFEPGERVCLTAEPAYQKGSYNLRFYGKSGTISGKRGSCYTIEVKDGSKLKTLIVHPVHLTKM